MSEVIQENYIDELSDAPIILGIPPLGKGKILGPSADEIQQEKVDVCIIGTGAAGSVIAHHLTNLSKPKKVVMVERGDYYSMKKLNEIENEKDLMKLHGGGFFTNNFSATIAQGKCVGGSTMINYGICMRMPESVYHTWDDPYGKTYGEKGLKDEDKDELTKAYDEIEDLYNVKPLPNKNDTGQIPTDGKPKSTHELFAQGCEKTGFDHGWMDKAQIGETKQNALNAFLEKSPKENLRIYPNCTAERIETDGNRIVSLIAIAKKRDIIRYVEIFADKFILSAGPIASSGFLLKNNICNRSGKVGQNVSLHPSMSVIGEFTKPVKGSDHNAVMEHYCDHFSAVKTKKPGFMIESAFVPPSQFSLLIPDFGKENLKHVRAKYDYVSMVGVFVHDDAVGKISLDANKDPILNYELSKNDRKKMIDGLRATAEIYFEAKQDEILQKCKKVTTGHNVPIIIENSKQDDEKKRKEENKKEIEKRLKLNSVGKGKISCISAHPQGGNQMGTNPQTSVVNPFGQSHDIPNFYICDASIFPTSLGVNPQLTVMAIAKIVAKKLYD